MEKFEFNGIWEFDIEVPDNSQTLSIRIRFEDDLSDNQEPLQNQIDTYSFIIDNIRNIERAIQERCLIKEERLPENFNLGLVTILMSSLENFSYFLVGSNESTPFLMYQNDILYIDRLDNKCKGIQRAIQQNGGTLIGNYKFIPKRFQLNSKYGILKPAHQKANETFEYNLIRYKHNDLFKRLVEQNEIDLNRNYKNGTLLSTACFLNNNELVKYLLKKGANTDGALHSCSYWNNNKGAITLLIENGVNINYQNDFGWTVMHRQASELSNLYQQKNRELKSERETESTDEKIVDRKKTIKLLVSAGADPYVEDSMNRNSVQVAANLTGDFKNEIELFFKELKN